MNIRKLFALSMSVVAGLTCMGGCGGGKENKDALLISVFDGGYGHEMGDGYRRRFRGKDGNPNGGETLYLCGRFQNRFGIGHHRSRSLFRQKGALGSVL